MKLQLKELPKVKLYFQKFKIRKDKLTPAMFHRSIFFNKDKKNINIIKRKREAL